MVVNERVNRCDTDVERRVLLRDALPDLMDIGQFLIRKRRGITVDVICRRHAGRVAVPVVVGVANEVEVDAPLRAGKTVELPHIRQRMQYAGWRRWRDIRRGEFE